MWITLFCRRKTCKLFHRHSGLDGTLEITWGRRWHWCLWEPPGSLCMSVTPSSLLLGIIPFKDTTNVLICHTRKTMLGSSGWFGQVCPVSAFWIQNLNLGLANSKPCSLFTVSCFYSQPCRDPSARPVSLGHCFCPPPMSLFTERDGKTLQPLSPKSTQ